MNIILSDKENHVREAMRLVLEHQLSFSIVGEASNAEILLAKACQLQPDVILLDWDLPGLHPQRFLTAIRQCCPASKILATSVKPEQEKIALELGVDAFLSKQLTPDQYIAALMESLK